MMVYRYTNISTLLYIGLYAAVAIFCRTIAPALPYRIERYVPQQPQQIMKRIMRKLYNDILIALIPEWPGPAGYFIIHLGKPCLDILHNACYGRSCAGCVDDDMAISLKSYFCFVLFNMSTKQALKYSSCIISRHSIQRLMMW